MTKEIFISELKIKDKKEIYINYFQGNQVWYFSNYLKEADPSKTYDQFKRFVATTLDVNFNDISLVGSGKLGYSLAPEKKFRDFNEESDLDLVIVSRKYFHKFWDTYLDLHDNKINFGYQYIASNIFRRFVSVKKVSPTHPFFIEWISKIEKFNKDYQTIFGIHHEINYRIYESWDDVERYHLKGIEEIKEKLSEE